MRTEKDGNYEQQHTMYAFTEKARNTADVPMAFMGLTKEGKPVVMLADDTKWADLCFVKTIFDEFFRKRFAEANGMRRG